MRVVELNEMKLVGIRVVCPGDQYVNEIPKATIELKKRLNEINGLVKPIRLIGAFVVGDFSEEEDGYWSCVEVTDIGKVPNGMISLIVPKQKYAVIRHKGPNNEIRNTYEKLHKWIEENKLERVQRSWHLEISDEWDFNEIKDLEIDLYDTIK